MLTKKSKYALLALIALARNHGNGLLLIADISASERIPHKFLEMILLELKNLGFLISKKGRGGGYALARAPELISAGDVIRCMEGPTAPLPCAAATGIRPCDECPDVETCGLRLVMRDVGEGMAAILDRTSLADVLARSAQAAQSRAKDSSYQI